MNERRASLGLASRPIRPNRNSVDDARRIGDQASHEAARNLPLMMMNRPGTSTSLMRKLQTASPQSVRSTLEAMPIGTELFRDSVTPTECDNRLCRIAT
jgi:hypothetical protein